MLLHSAAIPNCIGAPPSHAGVLQVASELLRLLFNFPHWQPELLRLYTSAPTPHASHCATSEYKLRAWAWAQACWARSV